MQSLQPASRQDKNPNPLPGRTYSFAVLLVASFLVGLTVIAVRGPVPADADGRQIDRRQLIWLGGIALSVAVLSLIPSRRQAVPAGYLTPQLVEQHAGAPVLGSLFAGPALSQGAEPGRAARWLRCAVDVGEMLVFAAFTLSLLACLIKLDLIDQFRDNPLAGYVESIRHLSIVAQAWLPAGMRDFTLKSQ
jgi:hypothetical protein